MFCKHCGIELTEDTLYCIKCGARIEEVGTREDVGYNSYIYYTYDTAPSVNSELLNDNKGETKKKRGIIWGVLFLLVLGVFLVAGMCYGLGLFYGNGREIKSISKDADTRTYRVTSDTEVTEEQMEDLLYRLQLRADDYTADSKITTGKYQGDWCVVITMPDVSEDVFHQVVGESTLDFVVHYGEVEAKTIVTNENIKSATAAVEQGMAGEEYLVWIEFDETGTKLFAEGTEKYVGESISIVFDGKVISAPIVEETITGGEAVINGMESMEEAEQIAASIRMGSLGLCLEKIE